MLVPGPKIAADARLLQEVVVLRRDDAAAPRRGCRSPPCLRSSSMSCGHQRLVAGRLARHADDVHVVLDRLRARPPPASGTAGRRRRRSRGRRTRWRSPWRRGRGRPGRASRPGCAAGGLRPRRTRRPRRWMRCQPSSPSYAPAVDAGDASGSSAWWRPKTPLQRVGDLADRGARARRLDRQLEQVAVAVARRLASAPSSAAAHLASSRLARILFRRATCDSRTASLSTSRMSIVGLFRRAGTC